MLLDQESWLNEVTVLHTGPFIISTQRLQAPLELIKDLGL